MSKEYPVSSSVMTITDYSRQIFKRKISFITLCNRSNLDASLFFHNKSNIGLDMVVEMSESLLFNVIYNFFPHLNLEKI